jgi:DNA-binding response OmpR family regulator
VPAPSIRHGLRRMSSSSTAVFSTGRRSRHAVQQVRMTQEDDLLQVVATSRGLSEEAGGYVAKPFNMNELLAAKQVTLEAPCRLSTAPGRSPPLSST